MRQRCYASIRRRGQDDGVKSPYARIRLRYAGAVLLLLSISMAGFLRTPLIACAQEADVGSTVETADETAIELTEAEQREAMVVERFWELLKKRPRRGTSLDRVYGYYVDTGRLDALVRRCEEWTTAEPDSGEARLLLGLVLARRGQDESAIEAFTRAETLLADDPLPSYYLGETLMPMGRLQDAADALQRAADRNPGPTDALPILQLLGRVHERLGDREGSRNAWQRMEEMFPNDLDMLARIAETLEEEGLFEEALKRYESLQQSDQADDYARVRFAMAAGDMKIRLGRKQEAVEDFERLLDSLATKSWLYASVRDRIERVFVRQADYAGLAAYYEKHLESHPNDLDVTRRLVVAMVRLGRLEEAKGILAETIEKAPSDVALRLALIDLLVNEKAYAEVDRQYAEIDRLDPNNPDYISQWGLAVLRMTELDEATRRAKAEGIWRRLVDARPDDPATIVMTADLMVEGELFETAETLYQQAIDLRPADTSYCEYLGYFYHQQKRYDEAIAALNRVVEGDRRSADTLMQLSNIFQGLGEHYADESLARAAEAVEEAPDRFEFRVRYVKLLCKREQFDEARIQSDVAKELIETDLEYETWAIQDGEVLSGTGMLFHEIQQLTQELSNADNSEDAQARAKKWWRVALLRQKGESFFAAKEPLQHALEADPDSLLVLRYAADLYPRINEHLLAVPIYERLIEADPANRVEHLKRLAYLQRDLGQADQAIETGRLVMATGAGNAANSRFFANMLLDLGRRGDGIQALRRAVRVDPTDLVSLSALAETLADDGQADEAIELLWRLFDKTDDLRGKMGVVDKMADYYVRLQRLDQLIQRLRGKLDDPVGRREGAYCLAQAYASVSDYHAARETLELLLSDTEGDSSTDAFLLGQLSEIAEELRDLPGAVRYQEMLCDLTKNDTDLDRLIELYYASGRKDQVAAVAIRNLPDNPDLKKQLSAIDRMLRREDYLTAETLLDHLLTKSPDHWELLYRKAEVAFRLDRKDESAELWERVLALSPADGEPSEMAARTASKNSAGSGMSYSSGMRIYNSQGYYTHLSFGYHLNHPEYQRNVQRIGDLLQTVFRDKLDTDQRSMGYGAPTPVLKPQWAPNSYGEAKLGATAWKLHLAMENKPLSIPQLYKEIRDQYPIKNASPETLRMRLKFELLLNALAELARHDNKFAVLGQGNSRYEYAASENELSIAIGLALAGERDWEVAAFEQLAHQLPVTAGVTLTPHIPTSKESLLIGLVAQTVKGLALSRGAATKKLARKKGPHGQTNGELLEWLVQSWERTARENPKQMTQLLSCYDTLVWRLNAYGREADVERLDAAVDLAGTAEPSVFMYQAQRELRRFEWANWSDLPRSREMAMAVPASSSDSFQVSLARLSFSLFSFFERWHYRAGYAYTERMGVQVASGDSREETLDEIEKWVTKATASPKSKENSDDLVAQVTNPLNSTVSSQWRSAMSRARHSFGDESAVAQSISLLSDEGMQGLSQYAYGSPFGYGGQPFGAFMPTVTPAVSAAATVEGESAKAPTEEEWTWLAKTEEQLLQSLDQYFEILERVSTLAGAEQETPATMAARRSQSQDPWEQLGQIIEQGFDEPESEQAFKTYLGGLIIQRHYGNNVRPNALLLVASRFCKDYDEMCKAHDREGGHYAKFEAFLAEKREASDPLTQKTLAELDIVQLLIGELEAYEEYFAKEYESATADGGSASEQLLLALACFKIRDKQFEEGIELIDAVDLAGAEAIKSRERLMVSLHARHPDEEAVVARAEAAIDRLLGFSHSENELVSLQEVLRKFDRKDEADMIRRRLIATARDPYVIYRLVNDMRGGANNQEEAVAFALRIFRMPQFSNPQAMTRNDQRWHARNEAITILKNAGKLDAIVEQLEAQWKSSPQSTELMWMLADIYGKMDRKEHLEDVVARLEKEVPDDAVEMQKFAKLLDQIGDKKRACEWNTKAFEKEPQLLFQDFWTIERTFAEAGERASLIRTLQGADVNLLRQHAHMFGNRLGEWLADETAADEAKNLLDHLWNVESSDRNVRMQLRHQVLSSMVSSSPSRAMYPYFKETMLETLAPPEEAERGVVEGILGAATSQSFSSYSMGDSLFDIRMWSTDRVACFASYTIECAGAAESLEELEQTIEEIVEQASKQGPSGGHNARYAQARIFLALIKSKLGETDEAVAMLTKINETPSSKPYLSNAAHCVADAIDQHDAAAPLALELYETVKKQWDDRSNDDIFNSYVAPRMLPLYLKSDNPEKGVDMVREGLRKSVARLKMIPPGNSQVRIGHQYYYNHDLLRNIAQLSKIAIDNGHASVVWTVYSKQCRGQSWYAAMLKERNNSYYTGLLKGVFDESVSSKLTVEDYVAHLDTLLPSQDEEASAAPDAGDSEAANEADNAFAIPLGMFCRDEVTIGDVGYPLADVLPATAVQAYVEARRADPDHPVAYLVDSKLFAALRTVAKEDPERVRAMSARLDEMAGDENAEVDLLLASALATMAGDDHAMEQKAVARYFDFVADLTEKGTPLARDHSLGVWLLVKHTITSPDARSDDLLSRRQAMLELVARHFGRIKGDVGLAETNDAPALRCDMALHLPDSLKEIIEVQARKEQFARMLMTADGQVAPSLPLRRRMLAGEFRETVAEGHADALIEPFVDFWMNGWPKKPGENKTFVTRQESLSVLYIFDQYMQAVEQHASEQPVPLLEHLLDVTLPPDRPKTVFLGMHDSFGGEDGFFRPLSDYMADCAVAEGKAELLLERVNAQRNALATMKAPTSWHKEMLVKCDVVEMHLALRQRDTEKIAALAERFPKAIQAEQRNKVAVWTIVAGAPAFSDPELLPLVDDMLADAFTYLTEHGQFPRYYYYAMRQLIPTAIEHCPLEHAATFCRAYQGYVGERLKGNRPDGFQFAHHDQLYQAALAAVEADDLADGIAVLDYFHELAEGGNRRRRDVTSLLDALEAKLDACDDQRRAELLGLLDLTAVRTLNDQAATIAQREPLIANSHGLPELPTGTLLFEDDFQQTPAPAWSTDAREDSLSGDRVFFGEFNREEITLSLKDLPEHQYLRVRFELLMMNEADGLIGYDRRGGNMGFGPDYWELYADDGPRLIATTFSNYDRDPFNHKQSYPDDFPVAFGVKPEWYDVYFGSGGSLQSDMSRLGFGYGRAGADLVKTLGPERSATYAMDIIFPHDRSELSLVFKDYFQDGRYEDGSPALTVGECWGLDNVRVEAVESSWKPSEEELAACWEALLKHDPTAAQAARWRLVAAGDHAVEYLESLTETDEDGGRKPPVSTEPDSFLRFRVERVLDIIGTPRAKELRKRWFGDELSWDSDDDSARWPHRLLNGPASSE